MGIAEEITNLYLYGQTSTPDKLDNSLIRSPSSPEYTYYFNLAEFMSTTGGGRFALGAQFDFIQDFFLESEALFTSHQDFQYGQAMSKQFVAETIFELDEYDWDMRQSNFSDGSDYALRAYIFNSMSFMVKNGAEFYIESDGRRRIENFAIQPRDDSTGDLSINEDFNFDGAGIIADLSNPTLEDAVDPSKIGRTVDIDFIGNLSTTTYDSEDFLDDLNTKNAFSGFDTSSLNSDLVSLVQGLWENNVTNFIHNNSRPIIYGTTSADELDANDDINGSIWADINNIPTIDDEAYEDNGVVLIGGDGNDTLIGGDNIDDLYGGDGDDELYGGEGYDWYIGGDGDDTYYIDLVDRGIEDQELIYDTDGQFAIDLNTSFSFTPSLQESWDTYYFEMNEVTIFLSPNSTSTLMYFSDATNSIYIDGLNDQHFQGSQPVTIATNGILTFDYTPDTPPAEESVSGGTGNADNISLSTSQAGGVYIDTFDNTEGDVLEISSFDTVVNDIDDLNIVDDGNGNAQMTLSAPSGDITVTIANTSAASIDESYFLSNSLDYGAGTGVGGSSSGDTLYGGAGNDTIWGNDGDDTGSTHTGNDVIYGGVGADSFWGGYGQDSLLGADGDDVLNGEAGNDDVNGGVDNDSLYGGTGNDTLWGDNGNDYLYGEADQDRLYGGYGDDYLQGDGGHDAIYGEWGNDTLLGGDGNDTVSGYDGNDSLYGGTGFDFVEGGLGADNLYGQAGNDDLQAGGGNDWLEGGDGNDTLSGGVGTDGLVGGAGEDVFFFGSTSESLLWSGDWIHDFTQGTDQIHLGLIASNITLIGGGSFSGTGGAELRQYDVGANTVAHLDADGDTVVDLEFVLVGNITLASTDFV